MKNDSRKDYHPDSIPKNQPGQPDTNPEKLPDNEAPASDHSQES